MNLKKAKSEVKVVFTLFIYILSCFFSNCTLVYKTRGEYDENEIQKNPVTLYSLLSDHEKYRGYESRCSDLLQDKYLVAMEMARQKYITVVLKAEELGIKKSPYLDTCCNQIGKIDSLLNENSMIIYCDSITKDTF
jgi:hypothetical protein